MKPILNRRFAASFSEKERGECSRYRASDDDAATQRRGEPDGASGHQSGAGPLVPRKSLGANGAVFLYVEGSRIFLHAPEAPGARASGPGEGDSHARSGEPADAGNIGAEVGCSPFYLSRIFSREVGHTIPQYLRNVRMERAAELLRTGRYNVTEAATEVGYSSLSHFSKAFCETIGCCPVLYPVAKNVLLDR